MPAREVDSAATRLGNEATRLVVEDDRLMTCLHSQVLPIKLLAETLAKSGQHEEVQVLEKMTVSLVGMHQRLRLHAHSLRSVMDGYEGLPEGAEEGQEAVAAAAAAQATDWEARLAEQQRALEEEAGPRSQADPRQHEWVKQFQKSVWKAQHPNEPMPEEEGEELVVMSDGIVKNLKCPITLQSVTQLADPVWCLDCKHIYSMEAISASFRNGNTRVPCPIPGCQQVLRRDKLVHDNALNHALMELKLRQASASATAAATQDVEDI